CPIEIKGREHFQKGKSYIVACNHNSVLDITLSSPFIPGANKTIAKNSFAKIPLFGLYYAKGSILVNRKSEKSRKESYEKMKWVCEIGMHICIYPEAIHKRTNEPLTLLCNAEFILGHETPTEVIPTGITGTKVAVPLQKPIFFWHRKLTT